MLKNLLVVLGSLLLVMVFVYWWWFRSPPLESPETLARQALTAGSITERDSAAARLAAVARKLPKSESRNPAREHLVRVMKESKDPSVRATCMIGLASIWDYDSMPDLLAALEDASPDVRQGAASAIQALISRKLNYQYSADDTPERLKQAAGEFRSLWDDFNKPGKSGKSRLQLWREQLAEQDNR